jgi:hypothetical protein
MSKQKSQAKKPENPRPERHDEVHEDSLDKTIEDSFPASDPPSSIPDPDEAVA